jgi:hypothetical protein
VEALFDLQGGLGLALGLGERPETVVDIDEGHP